MAVGRRAADDFGTDGGVHNFLRMLEQGGNVHYRGSIATFFYSRQAHRRLQVLHHGLRRPDPQLRLRYRLPGSGAAAAADADVPRHELARLRPGGQTGQVAPVLTAVIDLPASDRKEGGRNTLTTLVRGRRIHRMRSSAVAAGIMLVRAVAGTAVSSAQLGDVARKEAERRKTVKASGKTYTNDSLPAEPQPLVRAGLVR